MKQLSPRMIVNFQNVKPKNDLTRMRRGKRGREACYQSKEGWCGKEGSKERSPRSRLISGLTRHGQSRNSEA